MRCFSVIYGGMMMTRINLSILILLLSSLACVVPIVGEVGRNFINNFIDLEDKTPDPEYPVFSTPVDNSTIKDGIAQAAGTYKGTSNISDIWVKSFGGKVYFNNFKITIDKTGKITGILESFWETKDSEPMSWEPSPGAALHYCVTRMSNIDQGTITGSLMEPDGSRPDIYGLIEINMSAKKQIFRSDCPADDEDKLDYFKIYADIYINGDKLSGKVNNDVGGTSLTIEAVKQ
jgi:hypothetical protein